MEWTADTMTRLYDLYEDHIERLRNDVAAVNRSLGSQKPECDRPRCLTRLEFEAILTDRSDDPVVTQLWIRRIISGHEAEFPTLDLSAVRHSDSVSERWQRRGTGS